MSKIYYQEVAETLQTYINNLFNLPPTIPKMEELIRLGTECLKGENESAALDIFRAAFHLLYPLECGKDKKLEYAQTIYSSFCSLNSSGNEYIWECTGEYVTACRDFINNLAGEERL